MNLESSEKIEVYPFVVSLFVSGTYEYKPFVAVPEVVYPTA